MKSEDWELAAAVAELHFFKRLSKSQIADQLKISRFRAARLLDAGLEEGVYTIRINARSTYNTELSRALADRLGLKDAIVVASGDTEETTRYSLAAAAAERIKGMVHPGDIVGFSWGRSTLAVSEFLTNLPPVTVVPLTGMVGNELDQSPLTVLLRVAGGAGVTAKAIFAPMFAPTAEAAAVLRSDRAVSSVLDLYSRLSLAVASIGTWVTDPPISQVTDMMTAAEIADLRAQGVCAELSGNYFDADGKFIDGVVGRRLITATLDDLARTHVVAVAGTAPKSTAIAAACRSGLVKTLITDEDAARQILG